MQNFLKTSLLLPLKAWKTIFIASNIQFDCNRFSKSFNCIHFFEFLFDKNSYYEKFIETGTFLFFSFFETLEKKVVPKKCVRGIFETHFWIFIQFLKICAPKSEVDRKTSRKFPCISGYAQIFLHKKLQPSEKSKLRFMTVSKYFLTFIEKYRNLPIVSKNLKFWFHCVEWVV